MALDFGGSGMFPNPGLLDDIGKLNERWQQEGSSLKNIYDVFYANVSPKTIYTVTAGKVLYVHNFLINVKIIFAAEVSINDSAIPKKLFYNDTLTVGEHMVSFNPPLKFNSYIRFVSSTTGQLSVTMIGWEEDA